MQAGNCDHMHESGSAEGNIQRIIPIQISLVPRDQCLDEARRILRKYAVGSMVYRISEPGGKRDDRILMADTKHCRFDCSCEINIFCGII